MIYIQEGIKGVAIFSSLAIVYCVLSVTFGLYWLNLRVRLELVGLKMLRLQRLALNF